MRRAIISIFALAALGACATAAPYRVALPPSAPYPGATGPSIYATAAFASLHSELIACNHGTGSNIGVVGVRYEVMDFAPYIDTPAGPLLRFPTETACLSSGFGWRETVGAPREHTGIDLANPQGGFVYAAAAGRIVFAGQRGGYGNAVEIDHGHGVHSFYGHLAEIDPRLREGMAVPSGAPVARMGMTGNATGVHLHYEVWVDGLRVDPLHYGLPEPSPPVLVTTVSQDAIDKPIP